MSILKKLEILKKIQGYLGAGVYTPEGKMVAGVTEISGLNFEIAGSLFHDAFLIIENKSQESGFGKVGMLKANTEAGIVIFKCYNERNIHFHLIMVVRNDANVAVAELMLENALKAISEDFETP
jgi:roadblock/LC7 domain-containing protein